MTCSTHTCYWLPYWPSLPLALVATAMATAGRKMLLPLASLPHRSKLLQQQTLRLRLRSHAPWNRPEKKQTQESALLEFDEKVK